MSVCRRQSRSINISSIRNKYSTNTKKFSINNKKSITSSNNTLSRRALTLLLITRNNNLCNRVLCSRKVWLTRIICRTT